MKKILSILLLALAPAFAVPALAQKPAVMTNDKAGWHKIGETTVNMKSEKDEIVVMGKDRFKSLKIVVTDHPIYLSSMVVYFEGGTTEDATLSADLKPGAESRVIDLKGTKELKKVTFVYKTAANAKNERAHVELWGLK